MTDTLTQTWPDRWRALQRVRRFVADRDRLVQEGINELVRLRDAACAGDHPLSWTMDELLADVARNVFAMATETVGDEEADADELEDLPQSEELWEREWHPVGVSLTAALDDLLRFQSVRGWIRMRVPGYEFSPAALQGLPPVRPGELTYYAPGDGLLGHAQVPVAPIPMPDLSSLLEERPPVEEIDSEGIARQVNGFMTWVEGLFAGRRRKARRKMTDEELLRDVGVDPAALDQPGVLYLVGPCHSSGSTTHWVFAGRQKGGSVRARYAQWNLGELLRRLRAACDAGETVVSPEALQKLVKTKSAHSAKTQVERASALLVALNVGHVPYREARGGFDPGHLPPFLELPAP